MTAQPPAAQTMTDEHATAARRNIRFVLVEPDHPGNIGGAARALKNMGFTDLALVRPKRFPDPQATWRAAAAVDVLEAALVFDSLDDAIGDRVFVAGTSARRRSVPWPTRTAAEFAAQVAAESPGQPVAVLFGREVSGLTNDELRLCHLRVVIPADAGYTSLNLAMAVQILAYELRQALDAAAPLAEAEPDWDRPLANAAQMAALYAHIERVLVGIDFLDLKAPRQAMTRLKRLFARVRPDATEVAMFRGVLTHVERAVGQRRNEEQVAEGGDE